MKILGLLAFLLISAHGVSAKADLINASKGPVTYSCMSDALVIQGSDGSFRSCWPYHCQSAGFGGVYGAACYTFCNGSDMCQAGTVCDTSSSTCVLSH